MKMKSVRISTSDLNKISDSGIKQTNVMPDEIKDVVIDFISVKGSHVIDGPAHPDYYDFIVVLKGQANFHTKGLAYSLTNDSVVRAPYNQIYQIKVGPGEEIHYLRFRKFLDSLDRKVIEQENEKHITLFVKSRSECPTYTESIKSEKTLNRMILREGMIPRFCAGTVETIGPDKVDSHVHPMLDQIFLGLPGCNCTCYADEESAELTEFMLLHIPLGSEHASSVDAGKKLNYMWFDFFLTLEGQEYMNKQHTIDQE